MLILSKKGKWLKLLHNDIIFTGQLWIDRKNRKMITIYGFTQMALYGGAPGGYCKGYKRHCELSLIHLL